MQNVTSTNICEAWSNAEKFVDPTCDNYIYLMTDGVDNIGGESNIPKRSQKLAELLRAFCGKTNTLGYYVKLTDEAKISEEVAQAIEECNSIKIVDSNTSIDAVGDLLGNIAINTRDLPCDREIGFSNPGIFPATLEDTENEYLDISIKNDKISKGKFTLHFAPKDGLSVEQINKIIGKNKKIKISFDVRAEGVIITNPEIIVEICATELRTLDLNNLDQSQNAHSELTRTLPFLWLKGNENDTLKWDLGAEFNKPAIMDSSFAQFRIRVNNAPDNCTILFNSETIGRDSLIDIASSQDAIIEMVIPDAKSPEKALLTLQQTHSKNLDRINGNSPKNYTFTLTGELKTKASWLEWFFWIVLGLIVLVAILWFLFIKRAKYPTFMKGVITINYPYYASIRAKGARKIVISPTAKSQSMLDRIFTGEVIYHINPTWPCEVEIVPAGKNMRFRCALNQLISDPLPTWTRGESYRILDSNGKIVAELNIN